MTEQLSYGVGWTSQVVLVVKNLPAKARNIGDMVLIPDSERSREGGHGKQLQYSCLVKLRDKEAWWATQSMGLQRVQTLKQFSAHGCMGWGMPSH